MQQTTYTDNIFRYILIHLYGTILREKSLATNFGDSQFRRNRIYNFIISKLYVDKRLWAEYNEINRLTVSHNVSAILSSLSGNSANIFLLKVLRFHQMFRSKSPKVKNGLKLNVLFTTLLQFLVEYCIFFKLPPFNWIAFEIKMLSRLNSCNVIGIRFFWPLAGSH